MCFRRKNRPQKQVNSFWPTDGGPSDADYEKDTFEYYKAHKLQNPDHKKTSFDDDSSMTP